MTSRGRRKPAAGGASGQRRRRGLPFPDERFDLILSHEVLEHVQDDRPGGGGDGARAAARWAAGDVRAQPRLSIRDARCLLARALPFRQYPAGQLAAARGCATGSRPHVRVYSGGDLERLFAGLPVRRGGAHSVFGAYDNIIARRPALGGAVRALLQALESTPLRGLGLSHFWVFEKRPEPVLRPIQARTRKS